MPNEPDGDWDSCKMYVLRELQRMNALHEKLNDRLEQNSAKIDELKERLTIPDGKKRLEKLEVAVDSLETLRDEAKGKASQNSVIWAYIVGVVSLLGTIWAIIRSFASAAVK